MTRPKTPRVFGAKPSTGTLVRAEWAGRMMVSVFCRTQTEQFAPLQTGETLTLAFYYQLLTEFDASPTSLQFDRPVASGLRQCALETSGAVWLKPTIRNGL